MKWKQEESGVSYSSIGDSASNNISNRETKTNSQSLYQESTNSNNTSITSELMEGEADELQPLQMNPIMTLREPKLNELVGSLKHDKAIIHGRNSFKNITNNVPKLHNNYSGPADSNNNNNSSSTGSTVPIPMNNNNIINPESEQFTLTVSTTFGTISSPRAVKPRVAVVDVQKAEWLKMDGGKVRSAAETAILSDFIHGVCEANFRPRLIGPYVDTEQSHELIKLMTEMWHSDPNLRPSSEEVVRRVRIMWMQWQQQELQSELAARKAAEL